MKNILLTYVLILLIFPASGQEKTILVDNNVYEGVAVNENDNRIVLHFGIKEIDFSSIYAEGLDFSKMSVKGMVTSFDVGEPDLPVWSKLVEVPVGATVKVKVFDYKEKTVNIKDYGVDGYIFPSQPSPVKSAIKDTIPFNILYDIYNQDQLYKKPLARYEDLGIMRHTRLGRIEVSPFQYNPVTGDLVIYNNIEVEVKFEGADFAATEQLKSTYQSSHFNYVNHSTVNTIKTKTDQSNQPVKYVIISDPMFEQALKSLISWKTKKGFDVVTKYTDDPDVGNTTTSIKNYLKNLYENPSDGVPPTYLLLVGDVAQIPAFSGQAGGHPTDLYYCEFTGDYFPEMFYGRLSAESVDELQPQIDKILQSEMYQMPDPSFLENVLLVAGVDDSYAPTHGNGAVNYANTYYTNETNNIQSFYYLYGDDSGVMASNSSGASDSIRANINEGIAFGNYTAHCLESGWSNPSFTSGHIDLLSNENKYPVLIGNCCLSNRFNTNDCFGENIVKAPLKGALAYIGGSNDTRWDEDYYWAVGITSSITANPTYEETGLGFYDRLFHTSSEPVSDWYISLGQIISAGNLAVEESSSGFKKYYWEIYHLMGDPSYIPYLGIPQELQATYADEIEFGASVFPVQTEPNAYVALSKDDKLIDVAYGDESGYATLELKDVSSLGVHQLVITRQNRQPHMGEVVVLSSESPYVVLDNFSFKVGQKTVDTISLNDRVLVSFEADNISQDFGVSDLSIRLFNKYTGVHLMDSTEQISQIAAGDSILLDDAMCMTVTNKFKNGEVLRFNLLMEGEDTTGSGYTWNSQMKFYIRAPELSYEERLLVDDRGMGNGNLLPEPGETLNLEIPLYNEGADTLEKINATVSLKDDFNGMLSWIYNTDSIQYLGPGQKDTILFQLAINASADTGKLMKFTIHLEAEDYPFLESDLFYSLPVYGLYEVTIDTAAHIDTLIADYLMFYDSGGPENGHSNNEDDTLTFLPQDENSYLLVEFEEFALESGYDFLSAYYGGEVLAENRIGKYSGNSLPEEMYSDTVGGALTFYFTSDGSVTNPGWKASVQLRSSTHLSVNVFSAGQPVENAIVFIDELSDTTDATGNALFENLIEGNKYKISVKAMGYKIYEKEVVLKDANPVTIDLEKELYDVTFILSSENRTYLQDGYISLAGEQIATSYGMAYFFNKPYSSEMPVVISALHHFNKVDTIEINQDLVLKYSLDLVNYKATFNILFDEQPLKDAAVTFGDSVKTTTTEGTVSFYEKSFSNIPYKVERLGFKDITDTLYIDGKDTMLFLAMEERLYSLYFSIIDSKGPVIEGEIQISDSTKTLDDEGKAKFMFTNGTYNFTVNAPRYFEYTDDVSIINNDVYKTVMLSPNTVVEMGDNKIKMYPNPTNGILILESDVVTKAEIKVVDLTGKVVLQGIMNGTRKEINFSALPEGMYFLQISANKQFFYEKIIVH